MERKIIERYKCHLHFLDTSKEMCACLLRRFLLDRCMLRSSLFIREQSRLSFSILITVSILKGQFSLYKHLEVIKLKGQGVDKAKITCHQLAYTSMCKTFLPVSSTLRYECPRTQESLPTSFMFLQQHDFTCIWRFCPRIIKNGILQLNFITISQFDLVRHLYIE